jgi:hypothetical protein
MSYLVGYDRILMSTQNKAFDYFETLSLKDRLLISSLSLVITIISQIHKLVKEGLTSSDTTMIGSCNYIHNKKNKNLGLNQNFLDNAQKNLHKNKFWSFELT